MKSLAIIGFAVGTVLAGCAPTGGARRELTMGAAAGPARRRYAKGEIDHATYQRMLTELTG